MPGLAAHVSGLLRRRTSTLEAFGLRTHDAAVARAIDETLALLADHVSDLAVALDSDTIAGGAAWLAPRA